MNAESQSGVPQAQASRTGSSWLGRIGDGRLFGLRVSALVETVALLLVIGAIDRIWFAGNRFMDVAPHPFWIVVLLIAVNYGTSEGLAAAVLSSAALLVGNLPADSLRLDYFDWQIAVAARPMMWLAAAVILGELTNRHRRRNEDLAGQLAEANSESTDLRRSLTALYNVHQKLELTLAADLHSELAIHRSASRLYGGSLHSVLSGAEELLGAALKPAKFSLYLLSEGQLRLIHAKGWSEKSEYPDRYVPGDPLFDHIVGRRRVLSVARDEDERILDGAAVLAGPLRLQEDGHLLGMLKIERLPFKEFSYAALSNFEAICDLIAAAIANASRLQQPAAAPEATVEAPVGASVEASVETPADHAPSSAPAIAAAAPPAVPSAAALRLRARMNALALRRPLEALASQQDFDLCALRSRLAPDAVVADEDREDVSRAMEVACRTTLPDQFIVGTDGKGASDLLVLMPGVSLEVAEAISRALEQNLPQAVADKAPDAAVEVIAQRLVESSESAAEATADHDGDDAAASNVLPFVGRR